MDISLCRKPEIVASYFRDWRKCFWDGMVWLWMNSMSFKEEIHSHCWWYRHDSIMNHDAGIWYGLVCQTTRPIAKFNSSVQKAMIPTSSESCGVKYNHINRGLHFLRTQMWAVVQCHLTVLRILSKCFLYPTLYSVDKLPMTVTNTVTTAVCVYPIHSDGCSAGILDVNQHQQNIGWVAD